MASAITIEWLGEQHGLFVHGTLVAFLTDDQLIELTRTSGRAVQQLRARREAESAAHMAHALRIATSTTRAGDLTRPVDLEI